MIQDIEPHEYRNEYQPLKPDKDSIFLAYRGRTILAAMEGRQIHFPTFDEMEAYMGKQKLYEDYTYLFAIDGMRFYLGNPLGISEEDQDIDFRKIKGYEMLDTQTLREGGPKYLNFAGVTGWQLHRWYTSRRYCGRCGSPMVKDAKERMMFCP
ncbi:MAG: NADH pyrophosphatase zinc ribbon domain-containing protein, partial [[Clostridium] scindens]